MQNRSNKSFLQHVAGSAMRGAIGGLKWSLLIGIVFGTVLVTVQRETIAGAIIIQSMMVGIWVTIAASVGMIKGMTTFVGQGDG